MNVRETNPLRTDWTVDNSSFDSYVNMVHFEDGEARTCIEQRIGKSILHTALDIAGGTSGRAVHDLIAQGYVGKAVFTNLIDCLTSASTRTDQNIECVAGSLLEDSTWDRLKAAQKHIAPGGFDLVLHRPYGALQELTASDYVSYAKRILDLMAPGGVFYTQIPQSYSYAPDNTHLLRGICQALRALPSVEAIETSLSNKTLAAHDFCLIYKTSRELDYNEI